MLCVMATPKAELGISQNIVFRNILKMESKEIGL